ncbi:hypothetical protein ElyMa_004050500, partial [Elysia marginata]
MNLYVFLGVTFFTVVSRGQLHSDDDGVTCYICLDTDFDSFPKCLQHPIKCTGNVCEVCCDTNECVANVTNYLRLELVSSQNLFCPGRCHTDTLQDCVHTGRVCDRMQFCQVLIDHTNRVEGECLDDFELRDCQQEMRDNPCPVDFK